MQILLPSCEVRSWQASDAESLALHANDHEIWINVRDAFPFPYTLKDARDFLKTTLRMQPETRFAIVVNGEAVGGIGFVLHSDVDRVSAEIGYWLGKKFWGRGIATEAVKAITEYAIRQHELTRVYAYCFEWNRASCRVLEKAGYQLEGRLRRSVLKDGKIIDQFLYAYVP